jgi:hypothetical protein
MKKLITIMLSIFMATAINAQKSIKVKNDNKGWQKIGETTVNFKKDKDQVFVTGEDAFAALKFKVTEAPIRLIDIDIFFENGNSQNVKINDEIKTEGEGKRVDLNGNERRIKKIVFVYKTLEKRSDEKAKVEIYGLKKS